MSTDSQGRPLSDDGQWAWNGTEWVPAAHAAEAAAGTGAEGASDFGATTIAPSPLAGGTAPTQVGYASAPGGQPAEAPPAGGDYSAGYGAGYGNPPGGGSQYAGPAGYGAAPEAGGGYGAVPAYGPGGPGAPGYGPPAGKQKSRTPWILGIIGGLVVIAAVVVALVLTLGGGSSSSINGDYVCKVPGSNQTGTITLKNGNAYSLSDNGKPGKFTKSGDSLSFQGGSLDKDTATYNSSAHTLKLVIDSNTLTCTKK